MLKKILILLITLFMSITTSFAVEDTDIIAAAAIYIRLGMMPQNSLWEAFDNKADFVQWDCQTPKNKIAIYDFLDSDTIAKFNGKVTSRLYNFYYQGDYLEQLTISHNPPVALYKLIGDTIYQYDNKPNKKQGILGALGFYEDGPGHLVAYAKISPDGILTKFDPSGNKIVSFEAESNTRIAIFDANHKKIGYYNLLTIEQILPKNSSTTYKSPTTEIAINTYSVIPISIVWAKSNKFNDSSSNSQINNSTSISIYDGAGYPDGRISVFGSSVSVYDSANHYIGRFDISGSRISVYDSSSKPAGSIYVSGSSASEYNAKGNFIGSYSLFEDSITEYNSSGYPGGTYDISDGSISIYTSSGYPAGSFDF